MDGHQFDRLARAVAARRTRRGAIRGITGAAVAFGVLMRDGAAAQDAVPIGGACWDNSQCRSAVTGLICASNGFEYDGPRNCCAQDGGRCQFDEHCCGISGCFDGVCGYYGPAPTAGLPLGASCTDTAECGGNGVICTGSFTASGMSCCLTNGQACASDNECCFTDRCLFQAAYGGSRCVQFSGGQCLSDEGCDGDLVCFNNYCT
jgi:hypothetical protein